MAKTFRTIIIPVSAKSNKKKETNSQGSEEEKERECWKFSLADIIQIAVVSYRVILFVGKRNIFSHVRRLYKTSLPK